MKLLTIAVLNCMLVSAAATIKAIPGQLGRINLFLDFDKDNNTLLTQTEFTALCAAFGQKDSSVVKLYFDGFDKQKGTNDIGIYGYLKRDKQFFKNIGESAAERDARLALEKRSDADFAKFNKDGDAVLSKAEFTAYLLRTWSPNLMDLFGKSHLYINGVAENTYEGIIRLVDGELNRPAFRDCVEKRRFFPRFL